MSLNPDGYRSPVSYALLLVLEACQCILNGEASLDTIEAAAIPIEKKDIQS